jgi:AAA domain, putative AbiEii toxin, Type IV TA system
MLRKIEILGVGPADEMRLELTERLNLITGDNGLGKSFVLDVVWWLLAQSSASVALEPRASPARLAAEFGDRDGAATATFRSEFDAGKMSWKVDHGQPPEERPRDPGIVVHARADGSFSVYDPMRSSLVFWRKDESQRGVFLLDAEEVWNGKVVEGSPQSNGLIRDWVDWQRTGPEGSLAFQRLRRVLERLSPDQHEVLRPGNPMRVSEDSRFIPTLAMPYGDVAITHASAGMRRIAALAYVLVWAVEENEVAAARTRRPRASSLLALIDEVEVHLHPRWQRVIMPALLDVARALEAPGVAPLAVQLLVTTHSPLVLTSLEPHFDPGRDSLWTLGLHGKKVTAEPVRWERRGTASNWLTSDVFDLKTQRSPEAEVLIDRIDAVDPTHASREDLEAIEAEMRRVLGELDPLWGRWREMREAARAGGVASKRPRGTRASKRSSR